MNHNKLFDEDQFDDMVNKQTYNYDKHYCNTPNYTLPTYFEELE